MLFRSGKTDCTLKGWTVSENYYEKLDALDTGFTGVMAWETKAKMLSRQMVEIHSGHPDANFNLTDKDSHRCKEINMKAFELGKSWCSKEALARYEKYGKKMLFGEDNEPKRQASGTGGRWSTPASLSAAAEKLSEKVQQAR